MARIKVEGYLDTADFAADKLDDGDKSGLSAEGYEEAGSYSIDNLDDLSMTVELDD